MKKAILFAAMLALSSQAQAQNRDAAPPKASSSAPKAKPG